MSGRARRRWRAPRRRGDAAGAAHTRWAARWVATVALALVGVLALAPAATAEPPTRLDEQVTDTVGALAGSEQDVADALTALRVDMAVQLWVAYVATFDGLSGADWADATAELSGLGGNDVLFAVAIEDRAYGYSVAEASAVDEATIERIIAEDVEPLLAEGDWPGATIALAEGIGGGGTGSDPTGGARPLLVLLAVVVVGAGVVLVLVLLRRRWRGPGAGGGTGTGSAGATPAQAPIEELRQQAAAALIDADDAIRTSEQELGFAIAQFGEESAVPFRESLMAARADLQQAFTLQRQAQQLAEGGAAPQDVAAGPAGAGSAIADGAAPRTEREALDRILALCAAVDERLDAEVEHFDQLRDLEQSLDTVLPGLAARVTELAARLPAARATADGLAQRFPPAALEAVQANLQEADERLRFAQDSLEQGTELAAGGDRGAAATRARAAEESLGQAATLLDAVDAAPSVLDLAQRSVAALMAETERDLAEAEQLGLPAQISAVHHYASETLAWARTSVESGNYDPILVRRALEESDGALEQALVPQREAAATRARAEALLPTATEAAEVSIRIVDDFISTRRGAVGAEARTRLAEAQRRLAAGRLLEDPVAALAEMQAADHLADQANALAQQDVARYGDQQMRGGGPGNLGGAILGGILIDAMVRGGAGRSRGRPPGGFGGGSRPSTGRTAGSFGGGGTRGRRSGGGRF